MFEYIYTYVQSKRFQLDSQCRHSQNLCCTPQTFGQHVGPEGFEIYMHNYIKNENEIT
jgi:hypothetical protein